MPLRRVLTGPLAWALASVLVLSACSGDDGTDEPDGSGETSSAAADEPYLPVPDGVELTAQGSDLAFGDTATVAYEPRQDEVGVLDVTVSRIEKASFKLFVGWKLEPETRSTTPYFVHLKVENVGDTDLGGLRVPVYAVDGENRLVDYSTFASTFKPCPSEYLPKKFGNGDAVKTCLVYLAPEKGEVTAASFRPDEEFDPIVWTGDIGAVDPGGKKGGEKGGKKGGADKKGGKQG